MDIQNLKTMLEIQALQTLGNSTANTTNSPLNNNASMFSEMIQELLSGVNNTELNNTDTSNLLGAFSSQLENTPASQSLMNSLLYNGENKPFLPSDLTSKKTNNTLNNITSVVNKYLENDNQNNSIFSDLLEGANQFSDIIKKAATTYNIPEKLIASVMKQESNFKTDAISSAGATGLMQLMPGTAKYLGVQNSLDPEQNIMGGAKYLRQMLNQFDGNISLALAAYNAGPGNVKKYNGIPPFKETQNYVSKVMNYLKV